MKLLDQYERISIITTVTVMIITGVIYYFAISYVLNARIDKDLLVEENEIFDFVKLNDHLPQVFKSEDLKITFQKIKADTVHRKFTDVKDWKTDGRKHWSGRELVSRVKVGNQLYRVNIIESKLGTEYLIRLIFGLTIILSLFLVIVLFILNRFAIRNIWKPFYHMLAQIKQFNLTDAKDIKCLQSNIDEFEIMNSGVIDMSLRMRTDYDDLKTFIYNASHELMTPVAVLQSKLDTLIQTSGLNSQQSAIINDIYNTTAKLARLNKGLLFLIKIENDLFHDEQLINVKNVVENHCTELAHRMEAQNITLHLNLAEVNFRMSETLADILFGNLISNAIRHNKSKGHIDIELDRKFFSIRNDGGAIPLDRESIFERFNRAADSEGLGLGLTQAKQICDNYKLKLLYSFENGQHVFDIPFI